MVNNYLFILKTVSLFYHELGNCAEKTQIENSFGITKKLDCGKIHEKSWSFRSTI